MKYIIRSVMAHNEKGFLSACCPFCNGNAYVKLLGEATLTCHHFHGIENGTHIVFRTPVKNGLQLLEQMLDERLAKFGK